MEIMTYADHWNGGPGPWFGFIWLFVIAAAVGATIMFTRRSGGRRETQQAGPTASAESILAERFARGEITEDEYLAKVSLLK